MSPEQAMGGAAHPRQRLVQRRRHALPGLTGRLPYTGKRFEVTLAKLTTAAIAPKELNPEVPDDLDAVCRDLLRRDPDARPTAAEVLQRLGEPAVDEIDIHSFGCPSARPFVGRDTHIASLNDAFASLRAGHATVVFVHGQSGVGKSTLGPAVPGSSPRRARAVVLAGRCYEQESVAYKALDTLIDALSRLPQAARPARGPGPDAAQHGGAGPGLPRVAAGRGGGRRAQRGAETPDPQELRRRAFAALREMLVRIGDRRTLVLSIDDLQWGDLDSAALLTDLLRPPDPPLMMLLCCYRREDTSNSRASGPCWRRPMTSRSCRTTGASCPSSRSPPRRAASWPSP